MANVTDQDGLMDFSGEDREDTSDITTDDAVNIDYDGGTDEVDDDEAHIRLLRESMELDESDYEDESEEGDSGEDVSEEDDASAAEAFKNEENARNAERRRQEEAQRIEQIRMQSPEYQLMQQMQALTGKSPEQLAAELQEAKLRQNAVQQGVPLEVARRLYEAEQANQATQARLQQMEFDAWNQRTEQETQSLKTAYPMLDDNDLLAAKTYILQTLQNVNVPLKSAVFALHGEKIATGERERARTEALAEISGRKKSGVPMTNKVAKRDNGGLTDLERAAARATGLTDEEYIKYR